MTTRRGLWPAGIGVIDEDLARMADAAAFAPDKVMEQLSFPGGANGASLVKRVRPLLDELRAAPDGAGLGFPVPSLKSPRILCCEAAYYDGVTIGRVAVQPCAVDIVAASPVHGAQSFTLSGKVNTMLTSAAFSSSGAGRVDTVYLSVRFENGATVDRRMKDITTGVVSTQSVAVYADPVVTVNIAAGVEGSSTPGAVPADGSGQYNVAVCTVALPVGYVSGGVLFDINGSFVKQVWERSVVRALAVEGVRKGSMAFTSNCDAGPAGNIHTTLAQAGRGNTRNTVRAVFRHTAANALCVLDNALWWCLREVRVSVIRSTSATPVAPFGNYVPPSLALDGGASLAEDSGWVNSGQVNLIPPAVGSPLGQFFSTSGPPVIHFFARNSDGALVCTIADPPLHVNGDFYTVIAECFDQNVE